MKKNKGFSAVTAIILILIVGIAAAAVVYFWQQQNVDDLQKQVELLQDKQDNETTSTTQTATSKTTVTTDDEEENEEEEESNQIDEEVDDENTGNFNVELVYLDNVIAKSKVENLLSDTALKTISAETITGKMAVQSDSGKLYFTTIETNADGVPKSKIYSFDDSRDKLVELYWEKYGQELWLMGLDDNSLVVFKADQDFELKSCEEPWDYADQFEYLDLENITNGLENYTIGKPTIEEHQDYVDYCESR